MIYWFKLLLILSEENALFNWLTDNGLSGCMLITFFQKTSKFYIKIFKSSLQGSFQFEQNKY